MGDGECNEGSIWEAAMAAAHFKLDNLIGIIDQNNCQMGGFTRDVMGMSDMAAKWHSFGWEVIEVDGHDINQMLDAFSQSPTISKPLAVVAHTIKGKGASFAENNNAWHHAPLSKTQYDLACAELFHSSGSIASDDQSC
jgi:transketolase